MSGGGFVMVPEWLRRKKPSGNACLIYVTLGSYGTFNPGTGTYDECRPALGTMADDANLSESSVRRALAELLRLGAATKRRGVRSNNGTAPSIYRLIFGRLVEPAAEPPLPAVADTPCSPVDRGVSTGEQGGCSPVDSNQEVLNPEPLTKKTDDDDDARSLNTEIGRAQSKIEIKADEREERWRTARDDIADRLGIDGDHAAVTLDRIRGKCHPTTVDTYVANMPDADLQRWHDDCEAKADELQRNAKHIVGEVEKCWGHITADGRAAIYRAAMWAQRSGARYSDVFDEMLRFDKANSGNDGTGHAHAIRALAAPKQAAA